MGRHVVHLVVNRKTYCWESNWSLGVNIEWKTADTKITCKKCLKRMLQNETKSRRPDYKFYGSRPANT